MSDKIQEPHEEASHSNGIGDHTSKKRTIDMVEGEVIGQDTFKKVLKNAETIVVDSNRVTFLRLESYPETFGSKEYVFNPDFSNQVYNQEEEIYGYKDLEIDIHILGGSLHAYLDIKYSDKAPDADKLEHGLRQVFLQGFLNKKEFIDKLEQESNFKPLGEKINEYNIPEIPHQTYEVLEIMRFTIVNSLQKDLLSIIKDSKSL